MKFKAGDRVRVRQFVDMVEEFGLEVNGYIKSSPYFTKSMRRYCGKEARVESITAGGNYELSGIDGIDGWVFSPDTLEPVSAETTESTKEVTESPKECMVRLVRDALKNGIEYISVSHIIEGKRLTISAKEEEK